MRICFFGLRGLLGIGLALLLAHGAFADNAALTFGGQPTVLSGHNSISMASETVDMVVHYDHVDTDCSFTFKNAGPACTVRMGFPDFGMWAYAYEKKKPKSIFQRYQSFVDQQRVSTHLILGANLGEQWQVKMVSFSANATHVVREVYRTETGGIAGPKMATLAASYLLHTGASWKGPIGEAKIRITLAGDCDLPVKPDIRAADRLHEFSQAATRSQIEKIGGVLVSGPIGAQVDGRTITFDCHNLKPTQKDDILVLFRASESVLKRLEADYKAKHK